MEYRDHEIYLGTDGVLTNLLGVTDAEKLPESGFLVPTYIHELFFGEVFPFEEKLSQQQHK